MGQAAESVALYWDFENLHAGLVNQVQGAGAYAASRFRPQEAINDLSTIIEFALSVGPIAINRAFANWVSFNRYPVALLQSAIELIQIFPPEPQDGPSYVAARVQDADRTGQPTVLLRTSSSTSQ